MINVLLYLQRLKLAEEWVCHKIDGTLPLIDFSSSKEKAYQIDLSAMPMLSWDKVIDIYDQTGVMFWQQPINMRPVTFEEYCEFKQFIIK